jgi:hypothetical protein
MRISATIDFWSNGVGCFCHEAVARALHDAFDDVSIDTLDFAHQKYRHVAGEPLLERSAWFEFLRNGPRFTFKLSNGVTGAYSRYEIAFEIAHTVAEGDVARVRSFLSGLRLREIVVEEEA